MGMKHWWKDQNQVFIYLFICDLFNSALSSSDYIASNERKIHEQRIGKDMEGNGCGLI
jgi:hypothetical protein